MREGFISVGFMFLVSEAMYYIIGAINKTFPVLIFFFSMETDGIYHRV